MVLRRAIDIVSDHGRNDVGRWTLVAALVEGRTAKQCRERWCNQLNPDLNMDKWTDVEDQQLVRLVACIGRKWSVVRTSLRSSHLAQSSPLPALSPCCLPERSCKRHGVHVCKRHAFQARRTSKE